MISFSSNTISAVSNKRDVVCKVISAVSNTSDATGGIGFVVSLRTAGCGDAGLFGGFDCKAGEDETDPALPDPDTGCFAAGPGVPGLTTDVVGTCLEVTGESDVWIGGLMADFVVSRRVGGD